MRKRGAAGLAALAVGTLAAVPTPAAVGAGYGYCGDNAAVVERLPNGTRWSLCWRIDGKTGLVLEKVAFQGPRDRAPLMVLDQLTIAQLNVPYDSGYHEWNDVTSYGLGGELLRPLGAGDCAGSRRGAWTGAGGAKVLCVSREDRGVAHRLEGTRLGRPYAAAGHDLVLRTISKLDWYEYLSEYRLADDGRISVRLGATGDLAPRAYATADQGWPIGQGERDYAVSHHHNAFWRVRFNLGGAGAGQVEQFDSAPTGKRGRQAAIYQTTRKVLGREANLNTGRGRWWRVVSRSSRNADRHPRSYQLQFGANDVYAAHPEMMPDVTFSQYRPCEKFATFNQDPECDGTSILDYTDGEPLTDPVMWVRVGFHHVPRDEDQSPMPVHWQGFDLVPRDFSAQNPLTPAARLEVNGRRCELDDTRCTG